VALLLGGGSAVGAAEKEENIMDTTKHPLKSLGIMAPLVALLVFLANRFWPGLGVTDADVAPIIDTVDVLFGLVLGIAGRLRATTQISTSTVVALLLAGALAACAQVQQDAQTQVAAVQADPKQALDDACYVIAHQSAEADILANAGLISADTAAQAKAAISTVELYCTAPPADLRQALLAVEDATLTVIVTLAKR
jgi:hypothetical protein